MKEIVQKRLTKAQSDMGLAMYQVSKLQERIRALESQILAFESVLAEAEQLAIPAEDVDKLISDAIAEGRPVQFPQGAVRKIKEEQNA